jgi:DNA-binding beta-propeller fold protein YncE
MLMRPLTPRRRIARLAASCGVVGATAAMAAGQASAIEPLGQFGQGSGASAGSLSQPSGVAVDPAGNVYVAERANRRISVFSSQGGFLRAFGKDVVPGNAETGPEVCTASCKRGEPGGDAGGLDQPTDLALDPAANVYVTERENHRVSVFTAQGAFLRAFGKDVVPGNTTTESEVCVERCQPGSPGGAAGELRLPSGIAVDATATVYAGEDGNNRISVHTSAGAFLRAFGKDVVPSNLEAGFEVCVGSCKPGVAADGPGELNRPDDLATDAAGDLYVADSLNDRISVFSSAPAFLRAFGKDVVPDNAATGFEICAASCKQGLAGGEPGSLRLPIGTAVDATGHLYVGDQLNHRVSVFSPQHSFLRAFGKDVVPDNGGTGFEVCATSCQAGSTGEGPGELSLPLRVTVDCAGAVYVVDRGNERVQKLGEPGAQRPPCDPPPSSPAPPPNTGLLPGGASPPFAASPSNEFHFLEVKRNRRRGTAQVIVGIPGAGELLVRGRNLRRTAKRPRAAGKATLSIRPTRNARQRLAKRGSIRLRVRVTYTPTGGEPRTKSKHIVLKLTRAHSRRARSRQSSPVDERPSG